MKTSLIVLMALGSLLSASTYARENVLLQYTSTNGAVGPQHKKKVSCSIFTEKVLKVTMLAGVPPQLQESKIAFTPSVKNAQAISDLISKAKKGAVVKGPQRNGGGTVTYTANQLQPNDQVLQILLLATGSTNAKNKSSAAKTLVNFIKFNCEQQ